MRPQLQQPVSCIVQMNNQSFEKNYIDNSTNEMKIKQEVLTMPNLIQASSSPLLPKTENSKMESIEYISNEDVDNIQGKTIFF